MTLLWVSISIVLAFTSMWLLKLNKDLANRNEYLMKVDELKRALQDEEEKIPLKPLTSKQKELLKKNTDDNKED